MKIVQVGAGGYGAFLLRQLDTTLGLWPMLHAVVDPYVQSSPYCGRIQESGVPVFDSLEAFYRQDSADLVIIASPIALHAPQVLTALANGSHVLCEKPLTATVQLAQQIEQAARAAGRKCGVAFQWSFSQTMQAVKRDILDGKFGAPVSLRMLVPWPRGDVYYEGSTWKGRIRDGEGRWVLDSIATNAAAHYLHNLFYLLGDTMRTARMPQTMEAMLCRARGIESFDTCFLRGTFAGGATFGFFASHVGEETGVPVGAYAFENATVTVGRNPQGVTATWKDGRQTVYGDVNAPLETVRKIPRMIEAIERDEAPDCGVETILPHLAVCNALFDNVPIADIPQAMRTRLDDPPRVMVQGMDAALWAGLETGALPDPKDAPWAHEATRVTLDGYAPFTGRLFPPA